MDYFFLKELRDSCLFKLDNETQSRDSCLIKLDNETHVKKSTINAIVVLDQFKSTIAPYEDVKPRVRIDYGRDGMILKYFATKDEAINYADKIVNTKCKM